MQKCANTFFRNTGTLYKMFKSFFNRIKQVFAVTLVIQVYVYFVANAAHNK